MLQQGGDVRSDEVFPLAQPHDQRAILAYGDDLIRMVPENDAQGKGAGQKVYSLPHRLHRVPVVAMVDQLGGDFRIGLGGEGVALLRKEFPQLHIVFHNAVVHQRHPAALAQMGVGIHVAGFPMGGPAGMPHPDMAGQLGPFLGHVPKHLEPAPGLCYLDGSICGHADAAGIIAPVFQLMQGLQ